MEIAFYQGDSWPKAKPLVVIDLPAPPHLNEKIALHGLGETHEFRIIDVVYRIEKSLTGAVTMAGVQVLASSA